MIDPDYVGAYNATTDPHWRDPGSLYGTWLVLGSTVLFFPFLFLLYGFWRLLRRSCHLWSSKQRNTTWARTAKINFESWYAPGSVILHFLISLASACFFLYLVIHVNNEYNGGKTRKELVAIFYQKWVIWLEFALCLVDASYVVIRFGLMSRKLDILTSLDDLLTILVSVSGIAAPFVDFYYWGFMSLRFAQLASVLGTVGKLRWKIFSGLVFNYENVYFTGGSLNNYFVAFYMCGITLTTVGYGDFSPISMPGRIVIILGMLGAFWMLPPLIAAVLEPWRQYRANRSYGGSGHAIIFSRSEDVQTVVDQFYRAKKTIAENLLLMTPKKESSALRTFLKQEFLRLRVTHFSGNWCDWRIVQRALPGKAHFCLLVQNKFSDDAELADASLIGGALAVLRVSKNVPLYIQLNSSSRRFAFAHNIENIICMEDLRRGLLVQNCTAPGILTVLSNLIISKPGASKRHRKGWLAPYKNGLYAKFETDVSLRSVVGHSYANVCKAMRALYSISFLAIWNPNTGLALFPLRHTIEEHDVGQFIFDGGPKAILRHLESEELQKYLIMLKAGTQFDDIDHMKALSLADMIDSEDAQLVRQFNLFQRSNLSDLLSGVTRSSVESDSISHHAQSHEKVNSHSSPVVHHHPPAATTTSSPERSNKATHSSSPQKAHKSPEKARKEAKEEAAHSTKSISQDSPRSRAEEEEEEEEEEHVSETGSTAGSESDSSASQRSSTSSTLRGESHNREKDDSGEKSRSESPSRKRPPPTKATSSPKRPPRGPSLRDVLEHSRSASRGHLDAIGEEHELDAISIRSRPPEEEAAAPVDAFFAVHAAVAEQADPFLAPVIGPSLMVSHDELDDEIVEREWDQSTAKRASLEGKVTNHIIVCGKADEMTTSIVRRLYKRTPIDQDIVLLVNQVSDASQKIVDQLNLLAGLERIFIIIGSSMNPTDLSRAGTLTARVCLVLPDLPNLQDPAVQAAQDSNMLITYHLLDQTDVFPIVELMNHENEALMAADDSVPGSAKLTSARGCLFKRSLFDNILTQSVFKPHLIALFEQLSDSMVAHVALKRFWDELSGSGDEKGNILFGQVFTFLLERKNCLSIAIYRKRRDAEDQWLAKQNAKRRAPKYVVDAGRAFRLSKKTPPPPPRNGNRRLSADFDTHGDSKTTAQTEQRDMRIAINAPDSNLVMLRSDLIIVVEYVSNSVMSGTLASLPGSPSPPKYH